AAPVPSATGEIASGRVSGRAPAIQVPRVAGFGFGAGRPERPRAPGRPDGRLAPFGGVFARGTGRCCFATQALYRSDGGPPRARPAPSTPRSPAGPGPGGSVGAGGEFGERAAVGLARGEERDGVEAA